MAMRHNLEAYALLTPFLLGAVAFFAYPLGLLCRLSFSELTNIVGLKMEFTGFTNFQNVFIGDVTFWPYLKDTMLEVLYKIPLTIVFALMIAMLTNHNIKGKGFFRTVYFMPFLLGSGYAMQQLTSQNVDEKVLQSATDIFLPQEMISYLGPLVSGFITAFFSVMMIVLWGCGVQILLFLSGLQSISPSYYEAARVESANEWDCFWHITLPMLSPIILLCIVYSLVDTFNNINNKVLVYIKDMSFTKMKFDYAAAVSLMYALVLLALIGIVFLCMYRATQNTEYKGGRK
jgi:ABC-type sugar transport system permease subunit